MALTTHRQIISVVNTSRYFNFQSALFLNPAFAIAGSTFIFNDRPGSVTSWTRTNIHKLPEAHRTNLTHLSGTAAGLTRLNCRTFFCATTLTGRALTIMLYFDRLLDASSDLF